MYYRSSPPRCCRIRCSAISSYVAWHPRSLLLIWALVLTILPMLTTLATLAMLAPLALKHSPGRHRCGNHLCSTPATGRWKQVRWSCSGSRLQLGGRAAARMRPMCVLSPITRAGSTNMGCDTWRDAVGLVRIISANCICMPVLHGVQLWLASRTPSGLHYRGPGRPDCVMIGSLEKVFVLFFIFCNTFY